MWIPENALILTSLFDSKHFTLTVSTGYKKDVDIAEASPPARADFRTLPAGSSMGGGTATTVAASNQILLWISRKQKLVLATLKCNYSCELFNCSNNYM